MNVESFSENSPHFTVDNMSIQMRLRAEKTESFTRKIEDAIHEAYSKLEGHQGLVIEASGCDDTDIEALKGALRELGIKGRRTVEYNAGVYRIVISRELHEVVLGLCNNSVRVTRYDGYYDLIGSTTQELVLQYQERPAEKDPDISFAPRCELLLHEVRRKVLDYLPEKPLPPTVFEMAATESTAQVNIDAERWHYGSYFVTEETLTIDFRPRDLSLVFMRRDFTVENIERVLNGLEGGEYESVERCLVDRLDVKIAEKRALILVFEHWGDHDEIIRHLKQEFRVEWELYLQKEIEYAYKKKRDHKWILRDLKRTLQRLNEMRERFPPNPPRASLEDYRLCYRVVDDRTREVHVVDCDENGTVAGRNAQELKLHISPFVGFALKKDDVIHFTNTQLVELWQRALQKYKNNAERRTDVELRGLTDEGLRWQCKLLGLPTADLEREEMIQDIRRQDGGTAYISREDRGNGLIIASDTHIECNV